MDTFVAGTKEEANGCDDVYLWKSQYLQGRLIGVAFLAVYTSDVMYDKIRINQMEGVAHR